MRCGRRRRRAAVPGRRGVGSGRRCRSRSWSTGWPTRPGTRSRPSPSRRPRLAEPGHRPAACRVRRPRPSRCATRCRTPGPPLRPRPRPRPTRRQISARARSVNDACGAITVEVSLQVRFGHHPCGQRQTRLTHTKATGRPPAGRSRTQHGLRSCSWATAPHSGAAHQIGGRLNRLFQLTAEVRIQPAQQTRASPTSPPQHYTLVPPGASISVSLNTTDHEAPGPSPDSG